MYVQTSLLDTDTLTSSPGSADGRMRSGSQDGRMSGPCGPDPALAILTPRQALERGMTTRGPYGGHGVGSLISVDLQLSLASRLQALMAVDGSPEYELTWKQWDMPSGPPICRLRASARRTSDNGYGGWHIPRARGDAKGTRWIKGQARNLEDQARLAGWPTPLADDAKNRVRKESPWTSLTRTAHSAGRGGITSGSPAQTAPQGALNPALSLWLMGYPDEWLSCGVRAMQSFQSSRRVS